MAMSPFQRLEHTTYYNVIRVEMLEIYAQYILFFYYSFIDITPRSTHSYYLFKS